MPWGMSCLSDKMVVVLCNESRAEMTSESHSECNTAGSMLDCPKLLCVAFNVELQQNYRDRQKQRG